MIDFKSCPRSPSRGSNSLSVLRPLLMALAVSALFARPAAPAFGKPHGGPSTVSAHAGEGSESPITVPGRLDRAESHRGAQAAPASARRPLLESWNSLETLDRVAPARTAAAERLRMMADWNKAGRLPLQVGFARPLDRSIEVVLDEKVLDLASSLAPLAGGRLSGEDSTAGRVGWTGHVRVDEARDLRLHLTRVTLPHGAEITVYGSDGVVLGPVGMDLLADGGLWTPTVKGDEAWVEVSVPSSTLRAGRVCRFTVEEIAQTFPLDAEGAPLAESWPSSRETLAPLDTCLFDISCRDQEPAIVNASHAIGRMIFMSGGQYFGCSGGLLNDISGSGTPYFLTARHCVSQQAEVSSLEVTWDYRTTYCGGPESANPTSSYGGTLLTSNSLTDSTLVQLTSVPEGRFFFGWTLAVPTTSTWLRRVSHPFGGPQVYSETYPNDGRGGVCTGLPLGSFVYESTVFGGIAPGSSGSPVWNEQGLVVGELTAACGAHPEDFCDRSNSSVDGRFSVSFAKDRPWLVFPIPQEPVEFQAEPLSRGRVALTWTDINKDHNRFQVLQLFDSGWVVIKQKGGAAKRLVLRGLTQSADYQFGLRACRGPLCSPIVTTSVTTSAR